MNDRLTPEEREIERNAHQLRSVSSGKRTRVESIIDRARKNQAISLRLSEFDLEMVKKRAEKEGLPYQTLITTIIHKFVTDQLYDKNEFRKVLAGIQEEYGDVTRVS
jgi:predicted DNA binding CopG/RHH family protein